MSFMGFVYGYFSWLGKPILKVFKNIDQDIRASGMAIYPEVYASLVGFITLVCSIISFLSFILFRNFYLRLFIMLFKNTLISLILITILHALFPLLILLILVSIPTSAKYSRSLRLELETPYLAAYISTMAVGGVSPYVSLERIAKAPEFLFKELKKEAAHFFINVRALGKDPVTAIEESANKNPCNLYKELMLGYAATLKTGGDVVHYLQRQTELMFKDRISAARIASERIALLLEAYMAITVVLALAVYTVFIINQALAQAMLPIMSNIQFVLFGYILLPMLSMFFIYLADMMQPKYPVSEMRPYYVYLGVSLPLAIILSIMLALPFMSSSIPLPYPLLIALRPFAQITTAITKAMKLPEGFESGVGISIALLVSLIPSLIVAEYIERKNRGVQHGLIRFLRDLVEVRKTGLSPEKCIITLSNRKYGEFTKHLKVIANRIGWGIPLSKIYIDFAKKVNNWLVRITTFLLVESIEVGGGTPEILESITNFGEMIELIEKEKRRSLKPLIVIPYIGAIITTVVVLILIAFLNNIMRVGHMTIPVVAMTRTFVPPIVINAYLTGLTAGKISTEKLYGGFKHAFLLVLVTLIAMWCTPFFGYLLPMGFPE